MASSQSNSVSATSSRAKDTPDRPRRRHRPREETRAFLLDAATRVAIDRVADNGDDSHNALADVRIRDVLAEVNRVEAKANGSRLTTGAFYQIWADQADFQRDLLAHVMDQIATPGAREIEALAFQLVADGVPADEIFQQICDLDFALSRQSPEIFLALGLGALIPADMVRRAQRSANQRYLESLTSILDNVLRYGGRRLRSGRTMEDLIWAIEALEVGYLLRSRSHPEVPERADGQDSTARATAFVGIIHAFTELAASQNVPEASLER